MIDQAKLTELEATHKRIAVCKSSKLRADGQPEWMAVFRKPNRMEYKAYRAEANDESRKSDAAERLARRLVVLPTPEAFDAMVEDFPGIPEACQRALNELAGIHQVDDGK